MELLEFFKDLNKLSPPPENLTDAHVPRPNNMYRSEANQLTTPNRRFALHIFDEYICISKYGSSKCLVINRDFTKSSSENDSEIHFEIEDAADIPFGTGRFMPFYAIFGVYWLLKGPYLAIVTQARTAATGSQVVFQVVQQVDFIWIPANKLHNLSPQQIDDEERYIDILQQCARTSSLHFAYDYDITHSLQSTSVGSPDKSLSSSCFRDIRFEVFYDGNCRAGRPTILLELFNMFIISRLVVHPLRR